MNETIQHLSWCGGTWDKRGFFPFSKSSSGKFVIKDVKLWDNLSISFLN